MIFRTIGLSKDILAMDESLSCDPLYLGKVLMPCFIDQSVPEPELLRD